MNRKDFRARRNLLRFLAASPLLAFSGLPSPRLRASQLPDEPSSVLYQELLSELPAFGRAISSPTDAISVFDFDVAAREKLSPAHYGYLASGTDNDATVLANRSGFDRYALRVRRLTGIGEVQTHIDLFGARWDSPVVLAPVGNDAAFYSRGVLAAAGAAREGNELQIFALGSNSSLEEALRARAKPVWFQVYAVGGWPYTQAIVDKAEALGCPVLVLTVDMAAGHNRETRKRFVQLDPGDCTTCHEGPRPRHERFPTLEGITVKRNAPPGIDLNWAFIDRLRDATDMKLVLKGIVTREDAALCLEHGVDGIIVSNHGGRAENSGRSTIESLPEVVEAVGGKIPVLVDSGFRRGTDIFKALALGADAVCVGRPYLWGLASFGQVGVRAVLDILNQEFALVMRQCGVATVADIDGRFITQRPPDPA